MYSVTVFDAEIILLVKMSGSNGAVIMFMMDIRLSLVTIVVL